MNKKEIKKNIKKNKLINNYNKYYYDKITYSSDKEYDELKKDILLLEKNIIS